MDGGTEKAESSSPIKNSAGGDGGGKSVKIHAQLKVKAGGMNGDGIV